MVFDCDFSRRTFTSWLGRASYEIRSTLIAPVKYHVQCLVVSRRKGLLVVAGMGGSFLPFSPAQIAQPHALHTWSTSLDRLNFRGEKDINSRLYHSYIISSKRYEVYVQIEEEGITIKQSSHVMLINLPSSPTSTHIIVPPAYMACTSFPVIQKAIVVLPQLRPPQGAEALVVMLKRL